MTQLMLFDMDQLARAAVAAHAVGGAPLGYTTDYYAPEDLDAAWDRFIAEFGNFGCIPRSHMWHRAPCAPGGLMFAPLVFHGHELVIFNASTRCDIAEHDHSAAPLPGDYHMEYQGICAPCGWHAIADENGVVEAWHDHAMPGWRDLPVRPANLKPAAAKAWLESYPTAWQEPGSPIRTLRTGEGTRHVPGRSPWGGYDLASIS